MSLRNNKNKGNLVGNSGNPKNQNPTKRVVDIILSPDHKSYNSPEDIGVIFFVEVGFNQDYTDSTTLPSAKPLNKNRINQSKNFLDLSYLVVNRYQYLL